MKCTFCQTELAPDEVFCHNCGHQNTISEEPTPEMKPDEPTPIPPKAAVVKPKIKKTTKPLIKIVIAALSVIALLTAAYLLLVVGGIGGTDKLVTNRILYATGEKAFYIIDGKGNKATFQYASASAIYIAPDRSAAALTVDNEDAQTLYAIQNGEVKRVCNNAGQFLVSLYGDAIAYYTDVDEVESTASLYLYDIQQGKSTLIEKNVFYDTGSDMSVVLSPDGRTIAYAQKIDYDKKVATMRLAIDGSAPVTLGRNEIVLGVSNHADYLYYAVSDSLDGEWDIRVRHGNDDIRLVAKVSASSFAGFCFNADLSQVLLSFYDKTYVSSRGGDAERIFSDSVVDIVAPENLLHANYSLVSIVGWRSFANQLMLGRKANGTLYYIDRDFNIERVDKGISTYYPSSEDVKLVDGGSAVVYVSSDGELLKSDISNGDPREITRGDKITKLCASRDGKLIYFVNDYNELYCIRNGKSPVHIADDVDPDSCAFDGGSRRFYFITDNYDEDGSLYLSNNGGEKKKVTGGSDVYAILADASGLLFLKHANMDENQDDLYQLRGSSKLELLLNDITSATLNAK